MCKKLQQHLTDLFNVSEEGSAEITARPEGRARVFEQADQSITRDGVEKALKKLKAGKVAGLIE